MFTGIIEAVGVIKNIEGNIYTVGHGFTESFEIGESIALNGMCATILSFTGSKFTVEIIEESRRLTSFQILEMGASVNLERAARIGQRNSGHNVTGHIDQTGVIQKLERQGDYWLIRVGIDAENKNLIVYKGSVALEGISLTLSGVGDDWFEVSIISHTWEVTNLKQKTLGDLVNIEFDILGKYLLRRQE